MVYNTGTIPIKHILHPGPCLMVPALQHVLFPIFFCDYNKYGVVCQAPKGLFCNIEDMYTVFYSCYNIANVDGGSVDGSVRGGGSAHKTRVLP